MNIDKELFDKLCTFFARLDSGLTKGDIHLSRKEIKDILLELSREKFLKPEDVEKNNVKKYGTDAVRPYQPYFVPDTEHSGAGKLSKDTGLEYLKSVPNDWPPYQVTSTDLHKLQEDEEKKKFEDFMDFCEDVKSRPQYKEGTLEAELKFLRDYNDKN